VPDGCSYLYCLPYGTPPPPMPKAIAAADTAIRLTARRVPATVLRAAATVSVLVAAVVVRAAARRIARAAAPARTRSVPVPATRPDRAAGAKVSILAAAKVTARARLGATTDGTAIARARVTLRGPVARLHPLPAAAACRRPLRPANPRRALPRATVRVRVALIVPVPSRFRQRRARVRFRARPCQRIPA
jgi:hypothetical protein